MSKSQAAQFPRYGLRRLAAGAAVVALLAMPGLASATKLAFEDQATAAGQQLVERATQGDTAAAFEAALMLRSPNDEVLPGLLQQQQQAVLAQKTTLGAARSVRLTTQSHFAACIENEYRVRYNGGGEQLWTLKFRRGSSGYFLSNLFVRGS